MNLIYADPHPIPGTIPATLQMLQTVDALGAVGHQVTVVSPEVRSGMLPDHVLARGL